MRYYCWRLRSPIAAVVALLVAPAMTLAANSFPAPWVELGADGKLSVRMVVGSGAATCPRVIADGSSVEATQRGAADGDFTITVCTAEVPAATAKLTVDGTALPVLPAAINRVVVIGDTGCRVEGKALQDCNDPKQWPFPVIANRAAAKQPDLVIHVGDYYYRETACPPDHAGCAGTPHGDNWDAWRADFFDPAEKLLTTAPWVMVRGNHEACRRGGKGWLRLLDPRDTVADCADRSPPYRLDIGGTSLLVFDSAGADDFKPEPASVAAYSSQLAALLTNAPAHSWMLTHRPVFAMAQGNMGGIPLNQTEQAAIRGHIPPGLDLVLSGHLHDFTSYDFGPGRPAQLIVGTGGDTMLDLAKNLLVGADVDGVKVRKAFALMRFGFFVMERNGAAWDGTLYADDEAVLARCRLNGRELDCQ
jgi:hypothetical protein